MLEYYRFKKVTDYIKKGMLEEARLELAELQRRYVALCDENTSGKLQIQEYEDILYLARNLFFDGEFYWLITGSIKQGPFCPKCYDRDGLLMRLSGEPGDRFCALCREAFIRDEPEEEIAAAQPYDYEYSEIRGAPAQPLPKKTAKIIPFSK